LRLGVGTRLPGPGTLLPVITFILGLIWGLYVSTAVLRSRMAGRARASRPFGFLRATDPGLACNATLTGVRQRMAEELRAREDDWRAECRRAVREVGEKNERDLRELRDRLAGQQAARAAKTREALAEELRECRKSVEAVPDDGDLRGRVVSPQTGLTAFGFVRGRDLVDTFFSGMAPFEAQERAFVFSTAPPGPYQRPEQPLFVEQEETMSLDQLEGCGELDVVITGTGKCYAVVTTEVREPSYFTQKFAHNGDR
jgi:hypothetical protein